MMLNKRRGLIALAAAAALVLTGFALPAAAQNEATASITSDKTAKPTVVLVHGAFADSSGWTSVTTALQNKGYPVIAFSNPLRSPLSDGEYLRQFLSTISGPIVLVGHSYGGAVITNGATGNPNVKSLVYIAAYALAEGESVQAASALGGGHTDIGDHLVVRPFPDAAEGDGDAYIDPAFFPQLFAQDLPKSVAQSMAALQRPAALATLVTPSGPAAWVSIPSWYMVAKNDRIIAPEAERAMAARAGATTVEIKSSHVPMVSHPQAVVDLILKAAR